MGRHYPLDGSTGGVCSGIYDSLLFARCAMNGKLLKTDGWGSRRKEDGDVTYSKVKASSYFHICKITQHWQVNECHSTQNFIDP